MRVALGVAVFSGMLGVTIFGIFFTPVFYVVIRWIAGEGKAGTAPDHARDASVDVPVIAAKADGPLTAHSGVVTGTQANNERLER
jgi:hypothetical protein